MGIGTSLGAFHEDEFAHVASPWMEKPEDTPDNNVIDPEVDAESTKPITNLVLPISDIKTASPLVTITDADIDKAMNLGMSFSGGGLTTSENKVLQMRRAANDNNLLYNPREPNMIGSKEADDEIIASWKTMVDKQQKISDLYGDRAKLHDIRNDRDWSDIDLARFNKIGKEINEVSGDPSAAPHLEKPLKKYEAASTNEELSSQFEKLKSDFPDK